MFSVVVLDRLPHAEASYEASAHEELLNGTRVSLLLDLAEWAESTDTSPSSRFFVLSGAAGMGKSTVARDFARRLDKKKRLGASFFFVRSAAGDLGSTRVVFSTIAHQLASFKEFRPRILEASKAYLQTGTSQLLGSQLEKLIMQPLKDVSPAHAPIVIILDAVDECSDSANGDMMQFLALLKRLNDIAFPLRVLITTRPEMPIMHALRTAGLSSIARQFDMGSISPEDTDNDIKTFFAKHIEELYCGRYLLKERPNAIDSLTAKAEHLFIYAQTVVNAMKRDKRPEVALKRFDSFVAGEASAEGLSSLDTLYLAVLESVYPRSDMRDSDVRQRVAAVLASVVVLQDQISVNTLVYFFNVPADAVISTLNDLHSVISFDENQDNDVGKIRPLHSTFREFLADSSRCKNKDFYVDPQLYHAQLAVGCFRALDGSLQRNICKLPDPAVMKDDVKDLASHIQANIPAHVQYACKYWATHLVAAAPSTELSSLLATFCTGHILLWMEALSVMSRLDLAIEALSSTRAWYEVRMYHLETTLQS